MDNLIGVCAICEGPLKVEKGQDDSGARNPVYVGDHIPNAIYSGLSDGLYITHDVPRCTECGFERPKAAVRVIDGNFDGFEDRDCVTQERRSSVFGKYPRYWAMVEDSKRV